MALQKGQLAVADLKRRSKKGLELAKQTLLAERIESLQLNNALEHYLEHWNDFIHPGLFSIAYEVAGEDSEGGVQPQAAIAMIAAAFDIHDDIIDKSNTKYGTPTIYGKFGPEIALLLGNAFLVEGFKLLVDSTATLSATKRKRALERFKKLLFEVGNAHALEVYLNEKNRVTANDYMKIIEMKAAGVEADMNLGALLGGAKDFEVETLSRLGRILGILATLRDEFVDVFEIEELRQRISSKSLPLPVLFALEDPEAEATVKSVISKPQISKRDVDRLLDGVLEVSSVVQLKNRMSRLVKEGLELAGTLRKVEVQKPLEVLLQFMLEDL